MDDFFGDTPPHLNNRLAHQNVPYMIGINDSELGFLLPGLIQLGDPKTGFHTDTPKPRCDSLTLSRSFPY